MKHQLKIIMSYEEKDGAIQPITTPNIIVYRDDRPIGCIQNIKFQANVKELLPQLEFTFPNFRDQNIDNVASSFMVEVDDFIKTLSSIPNTKVIVADLDSEVNVCTIDEVGTDGHIESVPMKKRWENNS